MIEFESYMDKLRVKAKPAVLFTHPDWRIRSR